MKKKVVLVNNSMQKGYKYILSVPMGKSFSPNFRPELTPKEMLELGVFGGAYFDNEAKKEYPTSWFKKAKVVPKGTNRPDKSLNFFGVDASLPLSFWRKKGWINEKHDPRGWFEWYCRYYMGRRIKEEDERQIKRWSQMARHIAQIRKNCRTGDFSCRPRQRQALLHWAYDSRKL